MTFSRLPCVRWLVNHWRDNESQLYRAIPHIIPKASNELSAPIALQEHMVENFKALSYKKDLVPISSACLKVLDHISVSSSTLSQITELLSELIQQNLPAELGDDPRTMLSMGFGLKAYSLYSAPTLREATIWPEVYKLAKTYGTLPPYLEAVLASLDVRDNLEPAAICDCLIESLITNLHSSSHTLRKLSLEIIDTICARCCLPGAEAISTALAVENSPLNLDSARSS